jgi:predicted Fe-Mo cluster-binding NifX family protein
MRVLVTTTAPGLDVEIEPRFWHAAYLTIVDTDTLQWEAVRAPGAPSVHAAGTRLSLLATHQHVGAAISNDYGPNSYIVLESGGIPIVPVRHVQDRTGSDRAVQGRQACHDPCS